MSKADWIVCFTITDTIFVQDELCYETVSLSAKLLSLGTAEPDVYLALLKLNFEGNMWANRRFTTGTNTHLMTLQTLIHPQSSGACLPQCLMLNGPRYVAAGL